jgi:hypothetical protein
MVPMGYSGARGKLIHEKHLMAKISGQTPFKSTDIFVYDLKKEKKY